MEVKRKIINDPVFGFINVSDELLYRIICHPYFQRLNRIKQVGLASLIYPGAQHTRLNHSLGTMYLMGEAVAQLRLKGHTITEDERIGAMACILMHDLGHGPFSHVLENTIVKNISHEDISLLMMQEINREFGGSLDLAIAIFTDTYPKKYLHQLVSGQLDVDRLDYLRRDSFFTGVTEGNIGSARIIKMLNVRDDKLVVDVKGIYSLENFLMARRLMYWQVYLHKTSIAAEKMLINTLKRAKALALQGVSLFASPALTYFLYQETDRSHFFSGGNEALNHFVQLDDTDIWSAIKVWAGHEDRVLALLSRGLMNRKLFKIQVQQEAFPQEYRETKRQELADRYGITEEEADYLISTDEISTNMYSEKDDSIDILFKDGSCKDIAEASDMLNIQLLAKKVKKYYFCYLRD